MNKLEKELKAVRTINQMLLQKVDKLSQELKMEKEFHSHTLDIWKKAVDTIDARDADILILEMILGVEPLKQKKPF